MKRALPAVVAALFVLACTPSAPPPDPTKPPPPPRAYPDGAAGLHALWNDILVGAQRDERQKVHDLMASMMMVDDDLDALFGARANEIKQRYQPMILRLVNIGAMELVAQISDRKYDDVEVFTVDDKGTPEDRATLAALPPGTPVYGVRVKKKQDARGLRYDFFVYRNGHWITGNQLGKYLAPQSPAAPSADAGARPAARDAALDVAGKRP